MKLFWRCLAASAVSSGVAFGLKLLGVEDFVRGAAFMIAWSATLDILDTMGFRND